MSYNHENVVWQSPDGTWNRGFYRDMGPTCGYGDECDDETHEWCREFDHNEFQWVSTGHPTQDAAYASWKGSNPGGSNGASGEDAPHLDDMAARQYERAVADAARSRGKRGGLYEDGRFSSVSSPGYWGYHGPAKQRTLPFIQKDLHNHVEGHFGHRLGGYANLPDTERMDTLRKQIDDRLAKATPDEVAAYEKAETEHRDRLRDRLAKQRERRREEARRNPRFGMYRGYDPRAAEESRKRNEREDEAEAFIEKTDAEAAARQAARAPKPEAVTVEKAPAKKTAPKPATAKKSPAKKADTKGAPGPKNRQPKGIPTGGQFAAAQRSEADVALPAAPASTDWMADGDDPWS